VTFTVVSCIVSIALVMADCKPLPLAVSDGSRRDGLSIESTSNLSNLSPQQLDTALEQSVVPKSEHTSPCRYP